MRPLSCTRPACLPNGRPQVWTLDTSTPAMASLQSAACTVRLGVHQHHHRALDQRRRQQPEALRAHQCRRLRIGQALEHVAHQAGQLVGVAAAGVGRGQAVDAAVVHQQQARAHHIGVRHVVVDLAIRGAAQVQVDFGVQRQAGVVRQQAVQAQAPVKQHLALRHVKAAPAVGVVLPGVGQKIGGDAAP